MVLGIDIGGTFIKFGVIAGGEMLYQSKIPTGNGTCVSLLDNICMECERIRDKYPFKRVGVGVPGVMNNGLLTATNLPFKNTPLRKELENRLYLPVRVENDANCAALGEAVCGKGKAYHNMILVTLGTGIGGGVIVDKKILSGRGGAGEIGHMIIQSENGILCPCGQKGCWEQYASAGAFVRQAEEAAKDNPESILGRIIKKEGSLNGHLVFEAVGADCPVALHVFDTYLTYLSIGLKSLKNIFDPEIILLSGGITGQGDALLMPLNQKLGNLVRVEIATLQNDAGVFGAANL
ncbi:MAG: ROK family protein [Clostridia bacterium]|nr:ROK family protein [Clostridia bacterium]